MTLAGTVLSADTESGCQEDVACLINCHPDRDINSIKCDGADNATAPDQAWSYVLEGMCPSPPAVSCVAQCPDIEHIVINALGCSCEGFYSLVSGECLCLPPAQEVSGAALVSRREVQVQQWVSGPWGWYAVWVTQIHWDCSEGINISYVGGTVQASAGVASCNIATIQNNTPPPGMVGCDTGYTRQLLATVDRGALLGTAPTTDIVRYLYVCQ